MYGGWTWGWVVMDEHSKKGKQPADFYTTRARLGHIGGIFPSAG